MKLPLIHVKYSDSLYTTWKCWNVKNSQFNVKTVIKLSVATEPILDNCTTICNYNAWAANETCRLNFYHEYVFLESGCTKTPLACERRQLTSLTKNIYDYFMKQQFAYSSKGDCRCCARVVSANITSLLKQQFVLRSSLLAQLIKVVHRIHGFQFVAHSLWSLGQSTRLQTHKNIYVLFIIYQC